MGVNYHALENKDRPVIRCSLPPAPPRYANNSNSNSNSNSNTNSNSNSNSSNVVSRNSEQQQNSQNDSQDLLGDLLTLELLCG